MLFSSYVFILFFLPVSLLIYYISSSYSTRLGLYSLVILSVIFYAWNNPIYILLIYSSILINYFFAYFIKFNSKLKKRSLFSALLFNIFLLFLFKYYDFFIFNLNKGLGINFSFLNIALPLGISFFTFQQIGFIVSIYNKNEELPDFWKYSAFITFFPQLIAGPIIKHSDYLPQLNSSKVYRPLFKNLSIGVTIFIIGLYKKAILADNAGNIADIIYGLIEQNQAINCTEAWVGTMCYTFQIYFDFSGYSDMAIGLARMFNIMLPCNFLSPYTSTSVIEFWRRWHISLSSFLKEHIYIPLGGNRYGKFNRYRNLLITMLIGGIWHGAGWSFVIWGGVHGILLVINHLIRQIKSNISNNRLIRIFKTTITFLIINVTWIFFRGKNLSQIKTMLTSMFDFHNLSFMFIPKKIIKILSKVGINLQGLNADFHISQDILNKGLLLICLLFMITFLFPNVYDWLCYFRPAKDYIKPSHLKKPFYKIICWRPTIIFGILLLIIFTFAFGAINAKKEFIYFQF